MPHRRITPVHNSSRRIPEPRTASAAGWVDSEGSTMPDVGKTNIVVMWTVGPDDVVEGDRIFESHVGDVRPPAGRSGGPFCPTRSQRVPSCRTRWTRTQIRPATRSSCSRRSTSHQWACPNTESRQLRAGKTFPPSWTGAPRARSARCTAEPSSKPSGRHPACQREILWPRRTPAKFDARGSPRRTGEARSSPASPRLLRSLRKPGAESHQTPASRSTRASVTAVKRARNSNRTG
jgi:hypothetical protein